MSLQKIIDYDSDLHSKLLTELRFRYQASRNKLADRYKAWRLAEEHFRAYVKESDADAKRRAKREQGRPQPQTLFVPYSYAMTMAAHTYLASVFLARQPILQYVGRTGQAEDQTQAVEAIIDYQMQVGGMVPHLYVWLMDLLKYGIGVVGNYWGEEMVGVRQIEEVQKNYEGWPVPDTYKRTTTYNLVPAYAGNKLYNISPYDFLPDPTVSLMNYQKGEFCGRRTIVGWNEIIRGKEDGRYFNIDQLKKTASESQEREEHTSVELPDDDSWPDWSMSLKEAKRDTPAKVHLVELVWEVSPQEWGLGSTVWPEKWVFTVAENSVIIGAQPLGLLHGAYPYTVLSYEFDAYSHGVRGLPETVSPLSHTLNWLFDSRMANVRQGLNNQIIVDPSRIKVEDLVKGPGFVAVLMPSAYGTDPKAAFAQLTVADTTASHLRDGQIVMELLQRATGVSDNLMGIVFPGGRKTATEVRTAGGFGINRLKTLAEFCSYMGWSPLAQMLLQNTQMLMEAPQVVRITGDLVRRGLPAFQTISPAEIAGFFDFVPIDGTLPIDRVAQAALWKDMLAAIAQIPQISSRYDIAGIFGWMAQLAGLRNIVQFELRPDEQIAAMAQSGELVGPPKGAIPGRGAGGNGQPPIPEGPAVRPEAGAPILAGPSRMGPLV